MTMHEFYHGLRQRNWTCDAYKSDAEAWRLQFFRCGHNGPTMWKGWRALVTKQQSGTRCAAACWPCCCCLLLCLLGTGCGGALMTWLPKQVWSQVDVAVGTAMAGQVDIMPSLRTLSTRCCLSLLCSSWLTGLCPCSLRPPCRHWVDMPEAGAPSALLDTNLAGTTAALDLRNGSVDLAHVGFNQAFEQVFQVGARRLECTAWRPWSHCQCCMM